MSQPSTKISKRTKLPSRYPRFQPRPKKYVKSFFEHTPPPSHFSDDEGDAPNDEVEQIIDEDPQEFEITPWPRTEVEYSPRYFKLQRKHKRSPDLRKEMFHALVESRIPHLRATPNSVNLWELANLPSSNNVYENSIYPDRNPKRTPPQYPALPAIVPVPTPVPDYLDGAGDLFEEDLFDQFPPVPSLPALPYSFLDDPDDDYDGLFWKSELAGPTQPTPPHDIDIRSRDVPSTSFDLPPLTRDIGQRVGDHQSPHSLSYGWDWWIQARNFFTFPFRRR